MKLEEKREPGRALAGKLLLYALPALAVAVFSVVFLYGQNAEEADPVIALRWVALFALEGLAAYLLGLLLTRSAPKGALAAQYNPGKMSQEEYNAFLGDLVERGILSKQELGRLGYKGYTVVGPAVFDSVGFGAGSVSCVAVQNLPGQNPFNLYHSLLDAGGDVLAWAKVQAILNHSSDSPTQLDFLKGTQNAFQAMLEVLEAMRSQRDSAPL